MSAQVDDN
jgi:hypothetical protein